MAELGLLQNFSLPGVSYHRSAVEWSAENKIAVSSDRCVYIMSTYCSPLENAYPLPLHKQVIKAPAKVLDFSTVQNADAFMSHLNKEDIYEMMLDHTLSPNTGNAPPFLGYRCCRWSPKGATGTARCFLAVLTMDHRLSLYKEQNKDWIHLCDLSLELFHIHKKTWKSLITDNGDEGQDGRSASLLKKLKEKTYALAAMEICWTGIFHASSSSKDGGHEWCYLITAMRNGSIVCWRISSSGENLATLEFEHGTDMGLITSLCWQQTSPTSGLLIAGSLKGQVAVFLATLNCNNSEKELKLSLKQSHFLWAEKDRISADNIAVLKTSMRKYVVFATKKQFLVFGEISLSNEVVEISKVGHTTGLHKMPVRGFVALGPSMPQSHLLLSSLEGKLVKVKVSTNANAIECHHEEISIDAKLEHMMIQGIAASQNGLLCAAILNTAVYHDHLVKREPLQFIMFLIKDLEVAISEFYSVLKPQFSFLPALNTDICKYSDYLECVRAALAFGYPMPQWFVTILKMNKEDFEKQSQLELYFTRFLVKYAVSVLPAAGLTDYGDLAQKLTFLDSLIMRNYIFKVLGNFQDKLDLLTPSQSISLLLMVDFLFIHYGLRLENVYAAFGLECPCDVQEIPSREKCTICNSEVKLEDFKYGKCDKNHTFSRCCWSLLLCSETPYQVCHSCRSMALSQDVWGMSFTCTFCCTLMNPL